MENELLQYHTFGAVLEPLRSFNRARVIQNLVTRGRMELAKDYLEQFTTFEQGLITRMAKEINEKGEGYMRRHMLAMAHWLYDGEGYDQEVNTEETT